MSFSASSDSPLSMPRLKRRTGARVIWFCGCMIDTSDSGITFDASVSCDRNNLLGPLRRRSPAQPLRGDEKDVPGHGAERDLTYVDGIIAGVVRATDPVAAPDAKWTGVATRPRPTVGDFVRGVGFRSATPIDVEIRRFVEW
jgi:hypothetical protein